MSTVEGGSNIVTEGLVLYLDAANTRSYPGSGTIWTGLSKNGYKGTLINGPTFDTSNLGSIVFDGTDDYVEANQTSPTFFTLSTWFKATGVPSTNDQTGGCLITSSPQLFGGTLQYGLTYSWLNQRLVFLVQVNVGSTASTPNDTVLRNTIYNATGVYTGTKSRLYVNGILITEINYSSNPVYPTTGNTNTQIGRWGYPGFSRNFKGNIYQTSIYNRALTTEEILQNFNATKSRFGL